MSSDRKATEKCFHDEQTDAASAAQWATNNKKGSAIDETQTPDSQPFDIEYPEHFEPDFDRVFTDRLTVDVAESLERCGFAIVDNFLGKPWALAVRREIEYLREHQLMLPNQVKFLQHGNPITVSKPHIYELDLHHHNLRKRVPELDRLFWNAHDMAARINELMPRLELKTTPGSHTLKIQCNDGHGGCFPLHYDNPGSPDKRRLSCLLYLNPDWIEGDGGEVRLGSFLQPGVDVAPLMDRLVLFYSESMLHRVLPSDKQRYCLTIWLDSEAANDEKKALPWPRANADEKPLHPSMHFLAKPSIQRSLSRAVYEEEYEDSIRECMNKDASSAAKLLQSHWQHIEKVNSNPKLFPLILQLREMKTPLVTGQTLQIR